VPSCVFPSTFGHRQKSQVASDSPHVDFGIRRPDTIRIRRQQLVQDATARGITQRRCGFCEKADTREPFLVDRNAAKIVVRQLFEFRTRMIVPAQFVVEPRQDAVEDPVCPELECAQMGIVDRG
jgi:hypothetical protein